MEWNSTTELVLSTFGVPPYSARGLVQTLTPISQASSLARTVNGALIDFSLPAFRKYASTIRGADQNPPAFDMLWPGQLLTVDCVAELSYKTSGGSAGRTVVPGSSRVEGEFTIYRPRLIMRVVSFDWEQDEWMANVGWNLQLEEV